MMSAKKKMGKVVQAEADQKLESPPSVESAISIGTKEFFASEDALSDKTSAAQDAKSFHQTGEDLSAQLNKYHEEAKNSTSDSLKLEGLQIDIMLAIMRLRRLNRLSQFRNKKIRDRVAEERQKTEEQYLQLQNLLYEVSHIEKEVDKCLEFKSDHEDIEMVSVEQFYSEAPESIAKPASTKNDAHSQRLARLNWELETRKKLELELEKSQKEKAEFLKQIDSSQEQLSTMQPKLEALLEASKPLQESLDMVYDKEAVQRQYAAYLPACLYYLYIQALAYKEVFDRNFCVNIDGDLDRVKQMIADKRNAVNNEDDEESEDSESEGETKKHENQHHSQTKKKDQRRKTITEAIDDEKESDVLDPFPLHVELKTNYKGKATIYLKFYFVDYLGVVGVKSRLELMADLPRAVASANDLLSDDTMLAWLFAGDDGLTCPNPIGAIKLDYTKLDLKSKIDVTGRLYEWAQRLAGLKFPSTTNESIDDDETTDSVFKAPLSVDGENGTATGTSEQRNGDDGHQFFQSVLQRLKRRVIARLSLQEEFAAFESLNIYPPKEISSWFPSRIHSRMSRWSSMTYDDFVCHKASEEFRKSVGEEGWFCNVIVERGSAKLEVLVYIHVDYPNTAPLFCFLLSWNGVVYSVEKCSDLWHLSRAVNVECVRRLPKSTANYTLCAQLQFLISRLDVLLEIRSSERDADKEFPMEHLFQSLRKGRDRQLPFWFNENRNCYTFENL